MRDFDKYQKNGAYHYRWYDDPDYAWYKECVDRCVKFCEGSTLDVGCGDGLLSLKIAEAGHRVVGIDNSKESIRLANNKAYPKALFQEHDIDWWGLDGVWDYMVCLNVIEHLKKPDGLVRILKDNINKGAIIITDKATKNKGRYHEREYTLEELVEVFKEFNPKPFEIHSFEFGKPISFVGVEIIK